MFTLHVGATLDTTPRRDVSVCEELLAEMIGSHIGIAIYNAIWADGPKGKQSVGESLLRIAFELENIKEDGLGSHD